MTKNLLLGIAAVCGSTFQAVACTGISLTSRDAVMCRPVRLNGRAVCCKASM